MKKLLLIINDKSGGGKNGAAAFRLIKHFTAFGYEVTVMPIAEETNVSIRDYLAERSYDMIVPVGGDGTLNRTVNEVLRLESKPVIGYIPAGTTNDFSKNLGIPKNIDQAMRIITGGDPLGYDIGKFNDRHFIYVASFGAFAAVSYSTDQNIKNTFGYAAYILAALSSIPEQLSAKYHAHIETDDGTIEGDYIFGAFCNSKSVAGMKINGMTSNELHDGKFELFLVKYPDNFQEFSETARGVLQGDFNNPYIEFHRVTHASIHLDKPTEWTLDGEFGGNPDTVEFTICPDAVRIMTPKENK